MFYNNWDWRGLIIYETNLKHFFFLKNFFEKYRNKGSQRNCGDLSVYSLIQINIFNKALHQSHLLYKLSNLHKNMQ